MLPSSEFQVGVVVLYTSDTSTRNRDDLNPAFARRFLLAASGRLSKYCAPITAGGMTICVPDLEPKSTVMEGVFAVLGFPVPDNVTVCGLFEAASVALNKATRVPVAVGLNASVTVHDAPAPRLVPQVLLEMTKSPGSVLVIAILEMEIAAVASL